jgi:nucleoside-diphosphate-sugar epimerase
MRILITGVSGFIGRNLFHFLSTEHDVFGVSRTLVNHENCEILDFLNINQVKKYFRNNHYDIIINLVSKMASIETAKDIGLFTENLKIQTNIIEGLRDYGKCVFINFSSSSVYPNMNGEFFEDSIIDPSYNSDCLYGLSKFNSEVLYKFLFNKKIKLINLRVGYVYGKGMKQSRIQKVFERELKEKNTITVFGNGERVIPQIEINQLSKIINKFIKNPHEGVFNIAKENLSLITIAERIIKNKGNSESKLILEKKGNRNKFYLNLNKVNKIV